MISHILHYAVYLMSLKMNFQSLKEPSLLNPISWSGRFPDPRMSWVMLYACCIRSQPLETNHLSLNPNSPCSSCVSLDQDFSYFVPQIPHLSNAVNNNRTWPIGL